MMPQLLRDETESGTVCTHQWSTSIFERAGSSLQRQLVAISTMCRDRTQSHSPHSQPFDKTPVAPKMIFELRFIALPVAGVFRTG